MKIRFIPVAVVAALASSAAFADARATLEGPRREASKVAAPQPAPRAQSLVQEIAAGMREVLHAATPEIALPALELKLPTVDARR
jgi:hypothetical protein